MKKQLTAMAVIGCMMTATAQAFVPLSNSQINLGSFRNNATRGMFYTELDIFSASPVEIGDTAGNYLYTNWANMRTNSNLNAGAAGPLAPGAPTYDAPLGYTVGNPGGLFGGRFLTLGLSGKPLWFLPVVKGIRAGAVFQNSGAKAGSFNFDGDAAGISDLDVTRSSDVYQIVNSSNPPFTTPQGVSITNRSSTMKYYTNTTNTQWNAGAAWKGFILNDFDIGASFARISNQSLRTTGGTRTYKDTIQDDNAAIARGVPLGTRAISNYTATLADNTDADVASNSQTDALAQARLGFIPFLTSVSAGLGVRFARNENPGAGLTDDTATPIGTFEKNSVTVNASSLTVVGANSLYLTAEGIRNRIGSGLNYSDADPREDVNFVGAILATAPAVAAARATIDYKDSRTGQGPLARLEVIKKFDKVRVSVLGNFSTVKQNIDATQKMRAYSKTVTPVTTTRNTTFVVTDYTQDRAWTGSMTTTNLDGGGKVEFTAMEGVSLALGGFIGQTKSVSDITSATFNSTELTSFDDADATTNNAGFALTDTQRPDGTLPGREGTWSQSINRSGSAKTDSIVTQISVPIGVEIPLHKKWTFRAGTRYVMQKAKSTVTTTMSDTKAVTTVASAQGGALGPTTTYTTQDTNATQTTLVSFPGQGTIPVVPGSLGPAAPETHFMEYSYGIQFDPTKSLSLAANAFLDTNPGIAGTQSASILDLNTYRLLAIQAVFKF